MMNQPSCLAERARVFATLPALYPDLIVRARVAGNAGLFSLETLPRAADRRHRGNPACGQVFQNLKKFSSRKCIVIQWLQLNPYIGFGFRGSPF